MAMREAMVKIIGVKIHAMRPPLPMLAVFVRGLVVLGCCQSREVKDGVVGDDGK